MRIPLRRGRTILESDRGGQPPVAIVGETFARKKWPGEDPIGKQFRIGDTETGPWWTVVGVVGDVKHTSLGADLANDVYIPEQQWKWADGAMSFVVRTKGDPAALAPALRRAIWSVDKDQPIVRVTTMAKLVAATEAQRRFILVLFEAFAVVALALAAAGIYGVISGAVVERRREVGIRAALGASRGDILTLVVRQGLTMAGAGVVIGLVGALGLSRVIAGLLYGVQAFDLADVRRRRRDPRRRRRGGLLDPGVARGARGSGRGAARGVTARTRRPAPFVVRLRSRDPAPAHFRPGHVSRALRDALACPRTIPQQEVRDASLHSSARHRRPVGLPEGREARRAAGGCARPGARARATRADQSRGRRRQVDGQDDARGEGHGPRHLHADGDRRHERLDGHLPGPEAGRDEGLRVRRQHHDVGRPIRVDAPQGPDGHDQWRLPHRRRQARWATSGRTTR